MRTSGIVTTCDVSTSSRRSPRESTSARAWRTSSATRCWRCEGPAEGSKRLGTDSLLDESGDLMDAVAVGTALLGPHERRSARPPANADRAPDPRRAAEAGTGRAPEAS